MVYCIIFKFFPMKYLENRIRVLSSYRPRKFGEFGDTILNFCCLLVRNNGQVFKALLRVLCFNDHVELFNRDRELKHENLKCVMLQV